MDEAAEFLAAAASGDAERVAALLRERPALARLAGKHGKTALHLAAESDHVEVAGLLLDAGAALEAKSAWGATPLDWAATMGSRRVAELLLSRGASGLTLISAAALGKRSEVRRILASEEDLSRHRRRDAPEAPNDYWPADSAHLLGDILSDALYAAARNGHREVVEDLLARGARIDAKGVFGATGLDWAGLNGHAGTVELLVARGADRSLKDARFDATPAAWAEEGGHPRLRDLLRTGPAGP